MLFIQFLLNLLIIKQSSDFIQSEFEKFIEQYDKPYKNDTDEYFRRIKNFENSLKRIYYLNSIRTHTESAYYGITKYSDLSPEEFKEIVLKSRRKTKDLKKSKHTKRNVIPLKILEYNEEIKIKDLPQKFDWRDKNVVSDVRDQGKCGACWAYSIASTIETMVAIQTNKLQGFSTQQLIDCSTEENQGCEGGDTCSTLNWLTENDITLQTVQDYPSGNSAGNCKNESKNSGVHVRSDMICKNFVNDESKIIKLIANHGPLIAAVDASTWQNYLGGIIQYHCYNDRNHAVQITGYDLTGLIPFYKIRNTWDVDYGIDGYVHIAIGNNLCGIAEEVSSIDVTDIPDSFFKK